MNTRSLSMSFSPNSYPVFLGLPVPSRGHLILDQETVIIYVLLILLSVTHNPLLLEDRRLPRLLMRKELTLQRKTGTSHFQTITRDSLVGAQVIGGQVRIRNAVKDAVNVQLVF